MRGEELTSKTFKGKNQKSLESQAFRYYQKIGAEGFSKVYPVKNQAKKVRQQLTGQEFSNYAKELSKERALIKQARKQQKQAKQKPKKSITSKDTSTWVTPKIKKSTKPKSIPKVLGSKTIQIDMAYLELECYDLAKYGEIVFTNTARLFEPITLKIQSVWKDRTYIANTIFNKIIAYYHEQFPRHTVIHTYNLSFYFKDLKQRKTYKFSKGSIKRYYYE